MNEHDDLDAMAAAEFASYRQSAREAFAPAPVDGVFALASARAARRRVAVLTVVAAVVVMALFSGAVVVANTSASPEPVLPATDPPTTGPVPEPTPTPSPSPSPSSAPPTQAPAGWSDPGNQVTFLDGQTVRRLREATLTLPDWPSFADYCRGGTYTFHNGYATIGEIPEEPSGYVWTYAILFKHKRGILADVDGDGGDEILVPIGCGPQEYRFGLLALAPEGDGFRTLGYVVAATDKVGDPDRFFMDGEDIVVEVYDPLDVPDLEQRRRYRWQGDRFAQVGGPTELPTQPVRLSTVDLPNSSIRIAGAPCVEFPIAHVLSFVDGVSGVWAYEHPDVSHPAIEYLLGEVSYGAIDSVIAEWMDALVTLTCRLPDGHTSTWVHHPGSGAVVRVGDDGVTGIVEHRVVDGLAEVTVETAAGEQTRRYRTDGYTWEEVSS